MAICSFKDDDDAAARMAELFGPAQIDDSIRNAIRFSWMALPKASRNFEELEKRVRPIFERALRNFREDLEAFGQAK